MNHQDEFTDAVYRGDVVRAEQLLGMGATIGEDEILHGTVQRGDLEMLKWLLKSGGVEFIDEFDSLAHTPLAWAAKAGNILAMKLLLEAGAHVNAVNAKKIGNTVLREVVGDGNLEVIELLLRAGADPDIPGWMQISARDMAKHQWENSKSERGKKVLEMLNAKQSAAEKILSKPRLSRSKRR